MIYVFLGEEKRIIENNIDKLLKKINIDNIIKYDFDNCDIEEILNEVNYIDLFNDKKLLIISNFSFKKIKDKDEKLLIDYINNMNDNDIILKCIDTTLDERKKITKLLKEKCKVNIIKKFDYKQLHSYVTDIFNENDKNISYNSISKILYICDNNTDFVLNEVDKLLLYKINDKDISIEDIDNVVSKNYEKEMFKLMDYFFDKKKDLILKTIDNLRDSNTDEVVIIDYIAKQVRVLYQMKILLKTMSLQSVIDKLSINPYVGKKMYENINKFKEDELLKILYKLSDCDIDIKVNSLDKKIVLENFILQL